MQSTQRLWLFLTQPVFSSTKVILNPISFWNYCNSQHLERCWNCDLVQFLERCWMKDLELEKSVNQYLQK